MKSAIAVLTKAPEPGRVKTRLCPPLTPEQAARVHEASLRDILDSLLGQSIVTYVCHEDTSGAVEYFERFAPELRRFTQAEGTLGDRLVAAFDELFARGVEIGAIVGADSPTLPADILRSALAVESGEDIIIGPTVDGGYYLVAIAGSAWPAAKRIFERIPWSTSAVLRETGARAEEAGLRVRHLAEWYDIDTYEDLLRAGRDTDPGSNLGRLFAETWVTTQPPYP